MLWPLAFLATVIFLFRYYFHRSWKVLDKWNIPHDPPSIFSLGHARITLSNRVFSYHLECKKKYGPIWGYYLLRKPRIVIHDPEILRQVLIKEFSTFSDRLCTKVSIDGKDMASGLLLSSGEQWKRSRSTLSPAFSTCKLKQMAKIADYCIDNTISMFTKRFEEANGIFPAKDAFSRLSLDIICSTAFSVNVNSQDPNAESTILRHARGILQGPYTLINLLSMAFPFLSPLLDEKGGRQRHFAFFRRLCKNMIDRRDLSPNKSGRVDLLQLMIQAKISESEMANGAQKGLTPVEITGNAITMLLAGYETTGTAMTCLAYNLAQHPTVQKKLQEEIDDMYKSKENPDLDDMNGLKFLDMCVNENLRLYTPAPITSRTAKNEISLSGLTIPRGCEINVPIYALCHDPEFWHRPMEFDPERMRNPEEIDSMVFQPFGSGPRNCIGSKFALMETKLAFCKILRRFSFRPAPDTPKPPLKLRFGIASRPKEYFDLRVVSRKVSAAA